MTPRDADFLSAPLGVVTLLHLLTLTLHLAAMGVLLGGTATALGAALGGRRKVEDLAGLVRVLPTAMAATVTLGVAPLLFLQMVFHHQAYAAAIVGAWWWLLVVVAAMAAYAALYRCSLASEAEGRVDLPALALALAGLLYVSWTYSAVFGLAERPDLARALYARDATGWARPPVTLEGLLRWSHMVLGALAVGGWFVGWLGRDQEPAHRLGRRVLLTAMAAAAATGTAYLLSLGPLLRPFMRSPGIWGLTAGVLLAAGGLHLFLKRRFAASAVLMLASLAGMVHARHTVRLLRLAGTFDPATLRIEPNWAAVGLFLACFVLMLGALAWIARRFTKDSTPTLHRPVFNT